MRLQASLCDIATFCPLATNVVENAHAQHQNALHTWRGKSKGPAAAAECSVLNALVREHAYLKTLIVGETMPSRTSVSTMQKHLGRRQGVQPKVLSQKCRVMKSVQKKKRRLSAWNVFCRTQLKRSGNGQSLSQSEYTRLTKQFGQIWAGMSKDEKKEYQVDATYEQVCRDELVTRALPTKHTQREPVAAIPSACAAAAAAEDQPTQILEAISGSLFLYPKMVELLLGCFWLICGGF